MGGFSDLGKTSIPPTRPHKSRKLCDLSSFEITPKFKFGTTHGPTLALFCSCDIFSEWPEKNGRAGIFCVALLVSESISNAFLLDLRPKARSVGEFFPQLLDEGFVRIERFPIRNCRGQLRQNTHVRNRRCIILRFA